jgi:small subunit ribosomal protein S1
MVDRNIVNKLGLSEEQLDQQVSEMFSDKENEFLETALQAKVDLSLPGTIIKGKIVSQIGNEVVVEVGLKSEGLVNVDEFDDPDEIEPGREIEVLLEDTDSEGGLVLLNKRKADRIRGWETIISTKKEDDTVVGKVIRRIKGGLLVNIGVPVFLPASQVDIRKPGDISRFIGKDIECRILKIDVEGRNIVVSRRKLIEEERKASKEKVLNEVEVGQLRKGVVKNIADFGVFVDLGGVDGLLHISDLSWGRITHPSEIVKLDEEIECIVIGFDKEREKISLGLKQKTTSPWQDVEDRYKIGTRVKGKVVNVMNYGVFLRLEDGIEGLVHISEMSWTRRLNHPSEILNLGDEIEVVVLSVNKERQEISLGLKQTEINPWTVASQKYPPGTIVTAIVRGMTNFGAFVEIEEGISGMVHISDLSWTKKFNHPNEILKKDQPVKCVVLEVDEQKQRVSLGVKQMTEDPWLHAIPEKYLPGQIIKGKVTKIDSRKIGLSLRRAQWAAEDSDQAKDKTVADAEPQKPAEKQMPIGVQTVLSGLNLGGESPAEEVDEPKEKKKKKVKAAKKDEPQSDEKPEDSAETEAPAEPEPSTDEVKADVVEDTKPDDAEKAEAEPESDKKEDEPVAKVTEEPQAALDEEEPKTED